MKRLPTAFAFSCAFLSAALLTAARPPRAAASAAAAQAEKESGDSLNYADFEKQQDGRPVSTRGGFVQLLSAEETTKSHFKGLANASPPAPELVRFKPDDPNHAAAFDYEMFSPNQYASVTLEIHGQPDKDGKPVADDVSGYKFLSMQIYATGVPALRVEFISHGQGINIPYGFPQAVVRVRPGLNTYKIPLASIAQPSWADKVSPKDVLKKLTSVSVSAYCEQCTPVRGTVALDNVVFEKK
jgi:hypothetical protein